MSRVTLRQIATACDLSVATVSLALRDAAEISVATRARVRAAAERLGYEVTPLVSAYMAHLRRSTGRSFQEIIAYLYPEGAPEYGWHSGYYPELERAVAREAHLCGYRMERFTIRRDPRQERRLSQILEARGIRSVIVPPMHVLPRPLDLDWKKFAAVTLGRSLIAPQLHRVGPDQFQGTLEIVHALRSRGHRRIGLCIEEELVQRSGGQINAAFAHATSSAPRASLVPATVVSRADFAGFATWMKRHRPDAIIGHIAQIPGWLQRLGCRVPANVSYARINWHDRMEPCAGLDQRPEVIGSAAVHLLQSLLIRNERGVPEVPRTTLIPGRWVDGPTVRHNPPP